MNAIKTKAIIEGLRARKDRSLGLSVSTPELSSKEKALFFELQGLEVDLTIVPLNSDKVEDYQIEVDLNQKPQSVRMRNVLFIIWKQNPKGLEFSEYYRQETEKIIEDLKSKIEEGGEY